MTKINSKTAPKSIGVKTEEGLKPSNIKSTFIKMIDKNKYIAGWISHKKDVQATTGRDERETSLQILASLKQQ